ncbi:hypothetical protein D3C81_1595880 [compost metagenome]
MKIFIHLDSSSCCFKSCRFDQTVATNSSGPYHCSRLDLFACSQKDTVRCTFLNGYADFELYTFFTKDVHSILNQLRIKTWQSRWRSLYVVYVNKARIYIVLFAQLWNPVCQLGNKLNTAKASPSNYKVQAICTSFIQFI